MKQLMLLVFGIFLFNCLSLSAQTEDPFLLRDQFTPLEILRLENAYNQNRDALEEQLNQPQDGPLVNNQLGDCWDEIAALERSITAYKKIHLDCYYGYSIDVVKLSRLGRSIDRYHASSEEWSGWCYGYAALVFLDLISFLDTYSELNCID